MTNTDNITDLCNRYNQLLVLGIPNPYYKDKETWEQSVRTKVKELQTIIKKQINGNLR